MQLLDDYNKTRNEIFEYFGYKEDWVVIPLEDGREYHWCLDGTGPGTLHYADTLEMLVEEKDNYYTADIYTQRFLPKWVYRAKDYTMVAVDTRCDGNKFLIVLDNTKEYIRPHKQFEKMLTVGIPIKAAWIIGEF